MPVVKWNARKGVRGISEYQVEVRIREGYIQLPHGDPQAVGEMHCLLIVHIAEEGIVRLWQNMHLKRHGFCIGNIGNKRLVFVYEAAAVLELKVDNLTEDANPVRIEKSSGFL